MTIYYSAAQQEAILADYYANMPMKDITAKHGCEACLPARLAKRSGGQVRGKVLPWTVERTDKLRMLWGTSLSCSDIGVQLGTTKGAVIGRAHRLSLPPRGSGAKPKDNITSHRHPRHRKKAIAVLAAVIDLPALPREPRRLSLLQLTDSVCKWPIGDTRHPDFHFCGRDSLYGLPYCEFHNRLGHVTAEASRRVRSAA